MTEAEQVTALQRQLKAARKRIHNATLERNALAQDLDTARRANQITITKAERSKLRKVFHPDTGTHATKKQLDEAAAQIFNDLKFNVVVFGHVACPAGHQQLGSFWYSFVSQRGSNFGRLSAMGVYEIVAVFEDTRQILTAAGSCFATRSRSSRVLEIDGHAHPRTVLRCLSLILFGPHRRKPEFVYISAALAWRPSIMRSWRGSWSSVSWKSSRLRLEKSAAGRVAVGG